MRTTSHRSGCGAISAALINIKEVSLGITLHETTRLAPRQVKRGPDTTHTIRATPFAKIQGA